MFCNIVVLIIAIIFNVVIIVVLVITVVIVARSLLWGLDFANEFLELIKLLETTPKD